MRLPDIERAQARAYVVAVERDTRLNPAEVAVYNGVAVELGTGRYRFTSLSIVEASTGVLGGASNYGWGGSPPDPPGAAAMLATYRRLSAAARVGWPRIGRSLP